MGNIIEDLCSSHDYLLKLDEADIDSGLTINLQHLECISNLVIDNEDSGVIKFVVGKNELNTWFNGKIDVLGSKLDLQFISNGSFIIQDVVVKNANLGFLNEGQVKISNLQSSDDLLFTNNGNVKLNQVDANLVNVNVGDHYFDANLVKFEIFEANARSLHISDSKIKIFDIKTPQGARIEGLEFIKGHCDGVLLFSGEGKILQKSSPIIESLLEVVNSKELSFGSNVKGELLNLSFKGERFSTTAGHKSMINALKIGNLTIDANHAQLSVGSLILESASIKTSDEFICGNGFVVVHSKALMIQAPKSKIECKIQGHHKNGDLLISTNQFEEKGALISGNNFIVKGLSQDYSEYASFQGGKMDLFGDFDLYALKGKAGVDREISIKINPHSHKHKSNVRIGTCSSRWDPCHIVSTSKSEEYIENYEDIAKSQINANGNIRIHADEFILDGGDLNSGGDTIFKAINSEKTAFYTKNYVARTKFESSGTAKGYMAHGMPNAFKYVVRNFFRESTDDIVIVEYHAWGTGKGMHHDANRLVAYSKKHVAAITASIRAAGEISGEFERFSIGAMGDCSSNCVNRDPIF